MRVACIATILLAAFAGVASAAGEIAFFWWCAGGAVQGSVQAHRHHTHKHLTKHPTTPKPQQTQQTKGKTCTRHIKEYGQCGGGCTWEGAKKTCVGVFEGACCPAGWQCVRNDDFYFNCQPGRSAAQSSRFHSEANAGGANAAAGAGTLDFKPAPPVPAKMTPAGDYDYSVPLGLSFLFYEAQRAGKLNPKTNRIKWRGDAGAADRAPDGRDISKGWFDAGDNVKFNLPLAWSVGVLAWSVFEFKDGYKAAGQYDEALDNIRWGEFFLLCCC